MKNDDRLKKGILADAIRKRHLYIYISRLIQSENGKLLLFYIFPSVEMKGNEKKKRG